MTLVGVIAFVLAVLVIWVLCMALVAEFLEASDSRRKRFILLIGGPITCLATFMFVTCFMFYDAVQLVTKAFRQTFRKS